jgi:hypothetical protein
MLGVEDFFSLPEVQGEGGQALKKAGECGYRPAKAASETSPRRPKE